MHLYKAEESSNSKLMCSIHDQAELSNFWGNAGD
jgi:hypothetical protein